MEKASKVNGKHKLVIFHIKRKQRMTDINFSGKEIRELKRVLTSAEFDLYTLLQDSVYINPKPDYYSNENLAKELELSVSSVANAKSGLKQKGYALILKGLDATISKEIVRVIIGKEQVELFNLGSIVEIPNNETYYEFQKRGVFNESLTQQQRDSLIDKINKEHE